MTTCRLCLTFPGALTPRQRDSLCACGFQLQYHTLGHPHGFTGGTPACLGFRERPVPSNAAQLPLIATAVP